jgi:hypothetical protein
VSAEYESGYAVGKYDAERSARLNGAERAREDLVCLERAAKETDSAFTRGLVAGFRDCINGEPSAVISFKGNASVFDVLREVAGALARFGIRVVVASGEREFSLKIERV